MTVDDRIRAGLTANAMAFQPAVESSLDQVRDRGRRGHVTRVAVAAGLVAAASAAVLFSPWQDAKEPAPVTPVPSPTAELFGTYQSEVTRPGHLAGRWMLEFEGNGTVVVTPPRRYAGVVSGTLFAADSTTLRTNLFGQDACADLGNGEYSWTRDRARLALAESDEPCPARGRFFTDNTWIAISES